MLLKVIMAETHLSTRFLSCQLDVTGYSSYRLIPVKSLQVDSELFAKNWSFEFFHSTVAHKILPLNILSPKGGLPFTQST